MAFSMQLTASTLNGFGKSAGSGSVASSDQLVRCKRQMADWQACPSGKTPEGKRIIDALQAKIDALQVQAKSSEASKGSDGVSNTVQLEPRSTQTQGSFIDVFA